MTQVYIVAGVIIIISLLICYVFIRQTITKRKKEKMRLHRALDKRAKDLVQMLNAFPPNFLPKDLLVFLYRCIVDVYEQLTKLEPDNTDYLEHFKSYTAQMENAMRAPNNGGEVTMQSSTQINEIRQYLNYFGRFMQKWMQRGNISLKQYGHYKELLKKLVTQLMVDNYILSAKQAMQLEKPKLAVHYFTLAKNLLTKEGMIVSKKSRMTMVAEELQRLEQLVQKEAEESTDTIPAEDQEDATDQDKQWQEFEEQANWKKKTVYD